MQCIGRGVARLDLMYSFFAQMYDNAVGGGGMVLDLSAEPPVEPEGNDALAGEGNDPEPTGGTSPGQCIFLACI